MRYTQTITVYTYLKKSGLEVWLEQKIDRRIKYGGEKKLRVLIFVFVLKFPLQKGKHIKLMLVSKNLPEIFGVTI